MKAGIPYDCRTPLPAMAKLSFPELVRQQYIRHQPVTRKDLSGKTVIVLGANVGLGFEAAKHFASMKPGKLILACRSKAKGEDAAASKYIYS